MEDKLAQQRKELIKLQQRFEEDSQPVGEMWTSEQIQKLLRNLPIVMHSQGNQVVQSLVEFKQSKVNLKRVYSTKLLEANYDEDFKSAAERKAYAENSSEYREAEDDVIIKEGNYKAAELRYNAYEALYTAVKKASSMILEQDKAQNRATY